MTYLSELQEEEQNKEKIYSSFEAKIKDVEKVRKDTTNYYKSQRYDDKVRFTASVPMHEAIKTEEVIKKQYDNLYDKPYFAHIRLRIKDEHTEDTMECYLSDNESLEFVIPLDNNPNIVLIPFKQEKERPFLAAAFHYYQLKGDEEISLSVVDQHLDKRFTQTLRPELIRDIDLFKRKINSIATFLPRDSGEIEADELLAKRLEENRSDVKLRNIIATLQMQQFDIIRTDVGKSFVVQGCAGSGKTQCLIHRLFFLRDILQDAGWDKVLLITPSQLFRDYSSDLIRRYNLETVKNMSLASFYKQLLESFDRRFLGRQYVFEFTEEYLPDEYLKKIYSPEQISNIDSEIDNAIKKYVADACKLLEIKLPKEININFIKLLRDKLSATIAEIYQNEKTFSSDIGYKEHVKEINSLDKQVSEYQKKYELGVASKEKLYVGKNVVDELFAICQKAKEISSLKKIEEYQAFELFSEFRLYIQKFSKYDISCGPLNKLRTYNMLLTETLDKISLKGNRVISEQNDDALVKNVFEVCKTAIYGITQNKNIKQWLENRQKLIEKNELRLKKYSDNIKEINHLIEYNLSWFKEHNYDKSKINRDIYRTKLEKSKYVLSRIESTIFENEVWNAIAPLKNKYNIANIKEERLLDGHKKQYKILYKADLLFYLMIYCKLHKKHFGPKYSLICIDEGQDLHPADYKIIKTLYPLATLNVFGDVNQVIHDECGISDWQTETGIDNLFELNNNYRNNAAIVDFCNKNFGSNMIYNEKISSSKYPKILLSVKQINKAVNFDTVVIVKNKAMYEEFITLNIDFKEKLVYIDTLSEKVPNGCVLCYSIFAAKGLEFRSALVYSKEMTTNQKVVACTRATDELFYFG